MTKAIKDSKTRCWKELCEEVDRDPWGIGYKIVTGKLGARTATELKNTKIMRRIVVGLFATHPTHTGVTDDTEDLTAPTFTAEELTRATKTMKVGKVPGPDGIPEEIIWLVGNQRPEILLDLYNPRGIGYKIVTGTLGTRTVTDSKDAETMRRIVDGLFPTYPIGTRTTLSP